MPLHARCIPVGLPLHARCIPVGLPLHVRCIPVGLPLHVRCIPVGSPPYVTPPGMQEVLTFGSIITRSLVLLHVQLNWCTNKLSGPILLRDATIKSPVFSSPMKSLLPSVERLIRGHGPNARGGRWAPHSLPKLLCRDCSPGAPPWTPCEHCQPKHSHCQAVVCFVTSSVSGSHVLTSLK